MNNWKNLGEKEGALCLGEEKEDRARGEELGGLSGSIYC